MLRTRLAQWAARHRKFMQEETMAFLHAELDALRAEMQAERLTFHGALEQLRQMNEANLRAQRDQLAQMRKLYVELDIERLVETIDAALLTLGLQAESRPSPTVTVMPGEAAYPRLAGRAKASTQGESQTAPI